MNNLDLGVQMAFELVLKLMNFLYGNGIAFQEVGTCFKLLFFAHFPKWPIHFFDWWKLKIFSSLAHEVLKNKLSNNIVKVFLSSKPKFQKNLCRFFLRTIVPSDAQSLHHSGTC